MGVAGLLRWQWEGYSRYHASRANLLLHIVVVPLFLVANVLLVVALVRGWWWTAAVSAALMVVSVASQGRGHGKEAVPPEPFSGPLNTVSRIFLEQWITFPRFVLSGGWWHAMQRAGA